MIELSITAKSAATPPPAAPVSGAAPGGFARTLDALADGPPARPDAPDPRHDDAARGKKLPVAAADATDDPATTASTSSLPIAKPAALRRPIKPGASMVAPANVPVIATTARNKPSSDDDKPAKDDNAASDDTQTAASSVSPLIIAAPILIDPSPPAAPTPDTAPVGTRGTAHATANISSPPTASSSAGQVAAPIAPDPSPVPSPASGATMTATATAGMIVLPSHVQLLDAGATPVETNVPAVMSGVAAPRIATPSQTPHFAIAPATTIPANAPSVAVQPARQAFAAALAAFSARVPARDDDDTNDPHQPIAGLGMPSSDTLIQAAVQQVADSSQSALDPRHDRGLNGMIDHIEMLRDDANARDTRIRLTPDALGTVDVAVRRDGAALHVRFSSPNETTRAVLNDAQPRLAALAEARGVRIAGSSIDSGTHGHWGGNAQSQPHTAAIRPAGAPRGTAADDTDSMTDQRLA